MAEAIIRQHKRRNDRWMPKERRQYITKARLHKWGSLTLQGLPGYLLSFADVLDIPSGFHAAYGAALAATGKDVRPTAVGCALAMVMRSLSGLDPRWDGIIVLGLLLAAPMLLAGRRSWMVAVYGMGMMLPRAILCSFEPTAARLIQGWAAAGIAGLSAPMMARAIRLLDANRHISALEERIAAGYLLGMCICGGARMHLLGFNVGILLAGFLTLGMAQTIGVAAGMLTGMLAGVVLALQELPVSIAVALSMGGFLCGIAQSIAHRRISSGAFAMGTYLPLTLFGASGMGAGAAALASAVIMGLMPRTAYEGLQQHLRRFLPNDLPPGDAYAAAGLSAWEQTISAMAVAVPVPGEREQKRDGAWWEKHLCQGCPEYNECGCLNTNLGLQRAEQVWAFRQAQEDIWQDALENLRGLGCQRLYFLRDAMNALRGEEENNRRRVRQAEAQRQMLVTHLQALSGAARRFARLASGHSWWDDRAAACIRKALAERAFPASLTFVRRVDGHVSAGFELEFITGARSQGEELCHLLGVLMDLPMQVARIDGDRLLLLEQPLLQVEAACAGAAINGGEICGDTVWYDALQDGRYMAVLSDGMGHGESAARISRQTVELLRLCLEAGYTRRQTMTAVNGMLLLGGDGERFATADVLTIDLWKGEAALDKLGAAASWVCRQDGITRLTGDALPLGILEDVSQNGEMFKLSDGDTVVLLSDGVEEAFSNTADLEDAIRSAVRADKPQAAAEQLLAAALSADDNQRRDDQTVMVLRLRRQRPSALQTEHKPI